VTRTPASTQPPADVVVDVDRLRRFAEGVFGKLGMPVDEAALLADHLVHANLHGAPMLGAAKIPQYVARLRAGGTRPVAELATLVETRSMILLDAHDSWGQVVAPRAMDLAIEKARASGVGLAVVRNTTSSGTLGYYAMQAVRARLIGIAINNSPPLMPPAGGTGKVLGNQAFAIASPAGRHEPILLDMATSAITLARIHDHVDAGTELPPGVALDASGAPTVDPMAALAGFLLPMGGHRGAGLALMWEVLTGVLAGGDRFGTNVTGPDIPATPQGVSLFLLALDPEISMPFDDFAPRVDRLIDRIHASPPAPGVDRVTVPGERSFERAARGREHGVALPAALAERLAAIGGELGVAW
jgi:LDH2 family malate/lactate/ureidoglycolate dehydrogenase